MPTQFDLDSAHDDDVGGLPTDAQEMYRQLLRDGEDSRERIARINGRLQERIAHLGATQMEASSKPETLATITLPAPIQRAQAPQVRRQTRHNSAMRRWAAICAAVAVVIAFVAILSMNARLRSGAASSRQTPAGSVSPTIVRTTDWKDLTQLDYSTSFSANDLPAIAPSNPQIIYQTMAKGLQQHLPATLRATDDGGATWRTVAPPVPANHIGFASIGVSPVDPQVVFLSLIDTAAADCPANRMETHTEGFGPFCRLQFSSFDGGAHWDTTDLPLANGGRPGLPTAGLDGGMAGPMMSNSLRAQGRRLFAGFLCTDFSCTRLVTSDDGGRTWSFADLPMLAHGAANVCDYTTSASGKEVYAVTTTTECDFRQQVALTLWRSADAGATWQKARQLATPNERGMALTQNRATGARLLYMAAPVTLSQATDKMGGSFPIFSQKPGDVKVSLDGGVTWQSAPAQGIPSDHAVFLQMGLLGTLSDGSVVIDVIPPSTADPSDSSNFMGSDLYAWKPGNSGWRPIGSVSREIDGLLVIHAPTGAYDTIYAFLTTRNDSNTFSILTKTVAG